MTGGGCIDFMLIVITRFFLDLCSSGLPIHRVSVKMKKMQQEGRRGTSIRNSLST